MVVHRIPRLLAALALGLVCAPGSADDVDAAFKTYVERAEAVVAALERGVAPESQQQPLQAMSDLAADMIPPFSLRYPGCSRYLEAALNLRTSWSSLSIDTIERDYHHDAALPKPAHEGNRALCYQMKDLLVHPLTALRLLREQPVDVDSIRHEIVEVIAHGRALAALMNAGGT